MKIYEMIQSAYDGGSPAPNWEGFEHGEPVYIIKKRELLSLLYRVTPKDKATQKEIAEILKEDTFICREPDLP